jgi:hypothetical protein
MKLVEDVGDPAVRDVREHPRNAQRRLRLRQRREASEGRHSLRVLEGLL